MKAQDGSVITSAAQLQDEWKGYFEKLLNADQETPDVHDIPPAAEGLPIHTEDFTLG